MFRYLILAWDILLGFLICEMFALKYLEWAGAQVSTFVAVVLAVPVAALTALMLFAGSLWWACCKHDYDYGDSPEKKLAGGVFLVTFFAAAAPIVLHHLPRLTTWSQAPFLDHHRFSVMWGIFILGLLYGIAVIVRHETKERRRYLANLPARTNRTALAFTGRFYFPANGSTAG